MDTIDIKPTWAETANMLIVLLRDGNPAGQDYAVTEIRRMGAALDKLIAAKDAPIDSVT